MMTNDDYDLQVWHLSHCKMLIQGYCCHRWQWLKSQPPPYSLVGFFCSQP